MKTQCPGPLDEGDARSCGGNFINDDYLIAVFFSYKKYADLTLNFLERETDTRYVSYVSLFDLFRYIGVMLQRCE